MLSMGSCLRMIFEELGLYSPETDLSVSDSDHLNRTSQHATNGQKKREEIEDMTHTCV